MKPVSPPRDFDLPAKFISWRPGQFNAVKNAAMVEQRHSLMVAPTGAGKSVTAAALAKLLGKRTLILTSTKGLQRQYVSDFGFANVEGKTSYRCLVDSQWTCEDGPCSFGYDCEYRNDGCPYYAALKEARRSHVVITNYAMWMALRDREEDTIGKFELLILDEAHDVPDWVCSNLAVEITRKEVIESGGKVAEMGQPVGSVQKWIEWAGGALQDVEKSIAVVQKEIKEARNREAVRELKRLQSLERKIKKILRAKADWVTETSDGVSRLDPVWPREYTETVIFRGTPRIYMTSATATEKTVSMLGVKPGELWRMEQQSTFPVASRLITYVPTYPSARVDHRMTPEAEKSWLKLIAQIVNSRLDRKGILHSVSYKRRDVIAAFLQKEIPSLKIFTHGSHNTALQVVKFKAAKPPALLVSPSVSTGFDFPLDQARYQVICKIPFPDARSNVMKARCKEDKDYAFYLTAQELIQMSGRATRAMDDWSENLIVDAHFEWFWNKAKPFVPKWFAEAVRFARTIPQAPKIKEGN